MERGTTALTATLATLMSEKAGFERLFSRKNKDGLLVVFGAAISASSAMMLCYFAYKKSSNSSGKSLKKKDFVKALDLIPHPEGGYFRETHRSGATPMASRGKTDSSGDLVKTSGGNARNTMTSIYYLIEDYQGLVCNKSDHVHYFHYGCTVLYHIVNPLTGEYYVERLGSNLSKGDKPQVVVPGNYFKAATLEKTKSFDFALLGEGVGPGFDFRDFEFVSKEKLNRNLSNKSNFFVLERLCKPGIEDTDKFYEKTDNNNDKKKNNNKNNTNNNRNGSSDKLSKGKDISAPGLKKIPTPKIGGGQSTNAVAAPVNGEAKSPQPPLPPSPPPPNALRTTPNGNTVLADRKLTRSMATNPQIRFDDIGQSTPQFKPPKNINRIDRDNVEITPMGLKTRPEEDEGDKSLELESPL
ncbi:unnamed protein product [Bathycoccus prasinos]